MTHRERFDAVMGYKPFDRLPVWYDGVWGETAARWQREGVDDWTRLVELSGMDPEWEEGMWECQGMVNFWPISPHPSEVLEETDDNRVVRTALGAVIKHDKAGGSIFQHIEEALAPTRESWRRFQTYLDPNLPGWVAPWTADSQPARYSPLWSQIARQLNQREHVASFMGGSLYGLPRDWMGLQNWSMLAYDDPVLYEDIIAYLCDYFIALYRPILARVEFDIAFFFEDCCGSNGPMLPPAIYQKHYDRYYRKLIDTYRRAGVRYMLLDSDGRVDKLIPCWLDSGFDILSPVEVGKWQADPRQLRAQYGKRLRMMGGVDKHIIPQGEEAIRNHLEPLREVAAEGGYIPLPDHRIPPTTSFDQFKTYVRVFKEVFNGAGS
jgi:hypothetical protein